MFDKDSLDNFLQLQRRNRTTSVSETIQNQDLLTETVPIIVDIPETTDMAELQAQLVAALKEITMHEKPRIKDFDGKQDIDEWFSIFESQTEGKEPGEKLRLLSGHLKDGPESWFFTRKNRDTTPASIDEWKTRMLDHFGVPKQVVRNKLDERKLQPGEDFMKYMQDVQRLCERLSSTMEEEERLHHLGKGLTSYYKEKMMVMRPKTVAEFETFMKEIVAKAPKAPTLLESPQLFVDAIAKAISNANPKKEEPVLLASGNNNDGRNGRNNGNSRNNGDNRNKGNFRNDWNPNMAHPYMQPTFFQQPFMPPQMINQQFTPMMPSNRPPKFNGNCYNCTKFGHRAAECFRPKQQQGMGFQNPNLQQQRPPMQGYSAPMMPNGNMSMPNFNSYRPQYNPSYFARNQGPNPNRQEPKQQSNQGPTTNPN